MGFGQQDHEHRGEYAERSHFHHANEIQDSADRDHRHYEEEQAIEGLRVRISDLEEGIDGERETRVELVRALEGAVERVNERVAELEAALGRLAGAGSKRKAGDA